LISIRVGSGGCSNGEEEDTAPNVNIRGEEAKNSERRGERWEVGRRVRRRWNFNAKVLNKWDGWKDGGVGGYCYV
jgi:hypothetical protein